MAATPSGLNTASALLKQHYLSPDVIQNVMVSAGPNIMELLDEADTSAGGINIPFPIITAGGGGIGAQYAGAFSSAAPSVSSNFLLTRGYTYGIGQLGGELFEASENPTDAFVKNLTLEVDVKRRRVLQQMAMYSYNAGGGTIGSVGNSSFAVTTLTLNDPANAVNFQAGDVVQVAAPGSPTTPRTGTLTVSAVALIGSAAGTITMTGNLSAGIAAIAQNDLIFINGDCGATVATGTGTANAIPQGYLAWMPIVAPIISDNFFSVNRFNNTFLYGLAYDASPTGANLGGIREAATQGVSQLHQVSARPSRARCNPVPWYKLSLALQSQSLYPKQPDGGEFGFSSLTLPTPNGNMEVQMDPFCAPWAGATSAGTSATAWLSTNLMFLLEEDTWEAVGKGEIPHLDEADIGNYFLRVQGVDAYQFQFKAYWQIGSHAPGHNMVVNCPA